MAEETPKVVNKVYPYMPGGSTDKAYVQRYIRDNAELEDIAKKGHALPKEGAKTPKYWTAVDEPNTKYPENTRLVRVARENVLPDRAVRAEHIELHDPKSGKWAPIGGGKGEGTGAGNLLHQMNPQKLYKKGGRISLKDCKVNTVQKNTKHKNW